MYTDQEERHKTVLLHRWHSCHTENLKESNKKTPETTSDYNKVEGCKLTYRSQLLSCMSKDHVEFKVTNTIPFTLAAHKMILQINLTRYVQTLYERNTKC